MDPLYFLSVLLTGGLSGFLSGFLGIGGALVTTPLIRSVLKMPELIALGTPVPVMIPAAISGAYRYYRSGYVDSKTFSRAAPASFLAVIAGGILTKYIKGTYLMVLTALLLIFLSVNMLRNKKTGFEWVKLVRKEKLSILVGLVAGFLAGLLGIGGGFLLVPAFLYLFEDSTKIAFGTSLSVIAITAIPGTVVHSFLGHVDWKLAGLLSLIVIPFSYIGAQTSIYTRESTVKRIFSVFLIVFGTYFLVSEVMVL